MVLFSRKLENLQQLFLKELRDLYDGENQVTEALPKLIEAPEVIAALAEPEAMQLGCRLEVSPPHPGRWFRRQRIRSAIGVQLMENRFLVNWPD